MKYSLGPGPAAVEARMRSIRAAERHEYAAATEALWKAAQDPPHPDGRGPIAFALDTAARRTT